MINGIYVLALLTPGKEKNQLFAKLLYLPGYISDIEIGGTEEQRIAFWNSFDDKWMQPKYATVDACTDTVDRVFLGRYYMRVQDGDEFNTYDIVECETENVVSSRTSDRGFVDRDDVHVQLHQMNIDDIQYMLDASIFLDHNHPRIINFTKS